MSMTSATRGSVSDLRTILGMRLLRKFLAYTCFPNPVSTRCTKIGKQNKGKREKRIFDKQFST